MKACDILIIEDDPRIRDLILRTLGELNLRIVAEDNGMQGEARAREYLPAVIILDLALPGQSGIDLLRRIRSWYKGSVVVVTAWEDEAHKLEAFELGADDYVQKPFSPRELMARVKVALRRASRPRDSSREESVLRIGDLILDRSEHRVSVSGTALNLTQIEFRFLLVLADEAGHLVPQKRLLEEVWGPNHSKDSHYLRILVWRLRKKLAAAQCKAELVTEPGLGYRLTAERI